MKKNKILSVMLLFVAVNMFSQPSAAYYSAAEGKCGQALLRALNGIVGPHTNIGYDGLWEMYLKSDVRADGKIWDMYATSSYTPEKNRCGSYSVIGDCYNREHSFPKSWFDDRAPMVSDGFHVYPTDGKVNGQRSNFPYGECAYGTYVASKGTVKALGKLGASTFPGYSGTVFEPSDEYKGDFARSYFYMAAAYNDKIASWDSDMLDGTAYPCFSSWALQLLLKWHRNDPVSAKEIARNNAVESYQHNRNPFIDYPELVEYIWGTKKTMNWTPGGDRTPEIISPAADKGIFMGNTVVGASLTKNISILGKNITGNVNVTSSNHDFVVLHSVLTDEALNDSEGTAISIVFTPFATGEAKATITLTGKNLTHSFEVSAGAYEGMTALPASDVTSESFDANWVYIPGSVNYMLHLTDAGGMPIQGFPLSVRASSETFTIEGLTPLTQYKYYIANNGEKSNEVSVTTAAPEPILTLIYQEGSLDFTAEMGEPSAAVEVEVYTENISKNVTVKVSDNFELSFNKETWENQLLVAAEGESFYVRAKAQPTDGRYKGIISLTTPDFNGDEVDMSVTVTGPAAFLETFETVANGGYYNETVSGTACAWKFKDVGSWGSDNNRHDTRSVRFGSSSSSAIEMAEDKQGGAGVISFYAAKWNNIADGVPVVKVEYSTDGGENWIEIGSDSINSYVMEEYRFVANVSGNVRVRVAQIAGKRMNLDDVTITNYSSTHVANLRDDNSWGVYPASGGVIVNSEENSEATVYDTNAREIARVKIKYGNQYISLPNGTYIVVLDNERGKKIVVK